MIRLLHLNYHHHAESDSPEAVIRLHKFSSGFIDHISKHVDFISVKHMNHEGTVESSGIRYHFFRSRNKGWYIPFTTHRFIKQQNPDVVLIEGFVFPLQVIFLRWKLGKKAMIMLQHHGESPWKGLHGFMQKLASHAVNAYLFTSIGNAEPWIRKVIRKKEKCYEVLSASTSMKALDKIASREKVGMTSDFSFLWVGRLIKGKDPITVLSAFAQYCRINSQARLYMIFQTDELLHEVEQFIHSDEYLRKSVLLCGKVPNEELATWYSAADFYISGSMSEGSGYALVEAMTCGCIPVVTDIPPFRKITNNGEYGFLFQPGNGGDLLEKLKKIQEINREIFSQKIREYSRNSLSFEAISNQLAGLCRTLAGEKSHHIHS
jgi:glycosyltransferase involved in cell wall biosynthesis